MMATLMLSQGVPMLLAGDEFLRTQHGNNNAWCQDGELSWVDWTLADRNAEFLRFTRELIRLRKAHPVFRRRRFLNGALGSPQAAEGTFPPGGPVRPGDAGLLSHPDESPAVAAEEPGSGVRTPAPVRRPPAALGDIHWHGTQPYRPDFSYNSRSLAYSLDGRFTGRDGDPDYRPDRDFYVAVNTGPTPLKFTVPASPTNRRWHRLIDTAAASPGDILTEVGPAVGSLSVVLVEPFAIVVLRSEE